MNSAREERYAPLRMLPWKLLDTAVIPGDTADLKLYERDGEFSIRIGQYELMNTRVHGSEDALATLACARIAGRRKARVLIGGLGMGFTLAAVLRDAGPDWEVIVAELVPAVVDWHRGPLSKISAGMLDDPRVVVRAEDVGRLIGKTAGTYDSILLDVDNGPRALTTPQNDRLYTPATLRAIHTALRPKGVLAIWSSGPDAGFTKRLQRADFEVEEVPVRSKGSKGPRYFIWLATRA